MEKQQVRSVAALLLMAAVAVAVMVVAAEGAGGQGICKMSEEGLAACKPCIRSLKAEKNPTAECCAALEQADLPCFCRYQKSPLLNYLGIDPKLAKELPPKCSLDLPPDC